MSRIPIPILEQFPSYQAARWGLGTTILQIPTQGLSKIVGTPAGGPIIDRTHPLYDLHSSDWFKWRLCYEAGHNFIEEFTALFSFREDRFEFAKRKKMTPIPAFAKAAINEVKNAVFQRLVDVSRTGGSYTYQEAMQGNLGGVDLHGASMNWFLGHYILPELLVMRKVGVFVDSPDYGTTLKDQGYKHPYFYPYRAENIRNWAYSTIDGVSEFAAVLLRDYSYETDPDTRLPISELITTRLLYINKDGFVSCRYYGQDGNQSKDDITLALRRIPFVEFEITESLMKDVANHQIALLNMESSDVAYALKSNFPFYTEQYDPNNNARYVKSAKDAYSSYFNTPGGETIQQVEQLPIIPAPETEHMESGVSQGRKYPKGMERPAFIAPPPDPLRVSMEKQANLKKDVRELVHLALSTVQAKSASAESKAVDNQGLEAGLSYIGLELETNERKLATIWREYEGTGNVATVNYPKRWSLKTVEEINKEVDQHIKLRDNIPSGTFKKEMNKRIASLALGTRVSNEVLQKIRDEIDNSKGSTSDPKVIQSDIDLGILSQATGSELRGYGKDEVDQAAQDHATRLARIVASQSSGKALNKLGEDIAKKEDEAQITNPAARGVPDLSANPKADAAVEKIGSPGRGLGKAKE